MGTLLYAKPQEVQGGESVHRLEITRRDSQFRNVSLCYRGHVLYLHSWDCSSATDLLALGI